jgi:hypothetical protein
LLLGRLDQPQRLVSVSSLMQAVAVLPRDAANVSNPPSC